MIKAQQSGKAPSGADTEMIKQLLSQMQLGRPSHKFWGSQPVPQSVGELRVDEAAAGPIDTNEDVKKVKQDPYTLPAGFEWTDLSMDDEAVVDEIYTLLYENYVEDDDAQFRFDYSKKYLS